MVAQSEEVLPDEILMELAAATSSPAHDDEALEGYAEASEAVQEDDEVHDATERLLMLCSLSDGAVSLEEVLRAAAACYSARVLNHARDTFAATSEGLAPLPAAADAALAAFFSRDAVATELAAAQDEERSALFAIIRASAGRRAELAAVAAVAAAAEAVEAAAAAAEEGAFSEEEEEEKEEGAGLLPARGHVDKADDDDNGGEGVVQRPAWASPHGAARVVALPVPPQQPQQLLTPLLSPHELGWPQEEPQEEALPAAAAAAAAATATAASGSSVGGRAPSSLPIAAARRAAAGAIAWRAQPAVPAHEPRPRSAAAATSAQVTAPCDPLLLQSSSEDDDDDHHHSPARSRTEVAARGEVQACAQSTDQLPLPPWLAMT